MLDEALIKISLVMFVVTNISVFYFLDIKNCIPDKHKGR